MLRLIIDNTREPAAPAVPERAVDIDVEGYHQHLMGRLGLQPNTAQNYVRVARHALSAMGTGWPTLEQIETHMLAMRNAGRSHAHVTATMRVLEHYMAWQGHPVKLKRPRKPKRTHPEPLTEAEVAVILAHCKDVREHAILSLLATSGIRNEELCNLRVADVDMAACELSVREGKGLKDRQVSFDGRCVQILHEYLGQYPREGQSYLFTTRRKGEQYTTTALRRLVKRVVARTRIKKRVYPHLFRHSLATNLIARGAHVRAVQHILGHSFLETTMLYVETSPEYVRRAYRACAPSYL